MFVVKNFDVMPGDLGAKASAKGFDYGFFRCESAGEVGHGVFVFIAIILLALGKEAVEKMLPMSFDAFTDPVDLDDIGAESFDA